MKTLATIKTLSALALFGALSVSVTAQTPVGEIVDHIEYIIYDQPIKYITAPPPPPKDDENVLSKIDDNFPTPDHDPSPYATPEGLEGAYGILEDNSEDIVFPDHDPGSGIPVKTSLDEVIMGVDISVYPNPSTHIIHIDLTALEGVTIKMIDVTGRVVLDEQAEDYSIHRIDVRKFENGMYIMLIESANMRESRSVIVRA